MSDNKYGRIYTEEDVRILIGNTMGLPKKYENVDQFLDELDSAMTFPKEEPVFVLRAKDRLALGALRNYGLLCQARKRPPEHLAGIDVAEHEFDRFRIEHAARMKDPD